jgi:putative transposase
VAQITANPTLKCKHCDSSLLVKYGKYKGMQLYWCLDCRRKVKGDRDPFHMKASAEHVSDALDWYFQGLSIQSICDRISQKYGYQPSKHVVFNWVNKFTGKAIKHFRGYRPDVGTVWIAHETDLRLDKHKKAWLWDIFDARTRFLLATIISFTRSDSDAVQLVELACQEAGKVPETIITGKSASYINAAVLAFGAYTEPRHNAPLDVKAAAYLTGPCHAKIPGRTNVMRAFKDVKTFLRFNDGFRVYYNFLCPCNELEGKTPAEAANISYDVKNWVNLTCLPANNDLNAAKRIGIA